MARVTTHTLDDAPAASKEPLERQSQRVGKTINIFGAMAHSPAVIGLYDTTEQLLAERSSLDGATREAIHLTVANVNGCSYCQAAYTGTARAQGFSEDESIQIRRGVLEEDDKLTRLLRLSREIAADKGHVDDRTWKEALAAGWSDVELLDAYADVVRTILTNYFNHLVGTELDLPSAPELD